MRKTGLAVLAVALGLAGCRSYANSAPYHHPPLAELKTTGTYDVLQTAEGSSSGGVLLFVFPIGMEDKRGQEYTPADSNILESFFTWVPDAEGIVRSAALYNAIESQAGADALLAPRFETETTNYFFLYKHVASKCRGKAIRYNPTTNQ